MKRILIVDDHPISRAGIASIIKEEADLTVCGEAGSASEALTQIESTPPHLALIDINLPDRNGIELIKDLQALHPEIKLIAISMHDESLYAERVLRAGGQGYISKQAGGAEMTLAIQKVIKGGLYLSEAMSEMLVRAAANQSQDSRAKDPISTLTDRELEVLQHIGEGRNPRSIAEKLGVSHRTIEAHRTNIKEKLKLKDMTELIRFATRWADRSPGP